MSQLAISDGQPGNWEEPDFLLRRLETARFQEQGWQERYDGRLSRTDLWGPGGEIPLGYSTKSAQLTSPKSVWYPNHIITHFDNHRITYFGKKAQNVITELDKE